MTEPLSEAGAHLPLSVLVDQMAGEGPRDERFVRRFSGWFHAHAARLRLDALDALRLADVVLTFRMKHNVSLVAVGYHPEVPGEVTVRFHERDFPAVLVRLDRAPREDPYEVCTLDHSVEGRPIVLLEPVLAGGRPRPPGTTGRAIVGATIGAKRELRARLDGHEGPINLSPDAWRWLDESPPDDRA